MSWWMERGGWVGWGEAKACTAHSAKHVADQVSLCARTSSFCCHTSYLSVSFVLRVGCWDRREVREHMRESLGCGWRARRGGGDSTAWVLCWISSVIWFLHLSIQIHFSTTINKKQDSTQHVSRTSHTWVQGLLEIVLSPTILSCCAQCMAKQGLNLGWLIGQPEIKLCK